MELHDSNYGAPYNSGLIKELHKLTMELYEWIMELHK